MKRLHIIRSRTSTVFNALSLVTAVVIFMMVFALPVKAQAPSEIQSTPLTLATKKSTSLATDQRILPGYHLEQMGVSNMNVTLGKSTLLKLPAAINRISVGSPNIADVRMINSREVYVLGKLIGMTNITLWTKGGKSRVIDVTVLMDATALQNQLLEIMPNEQDIKVTAAGDSLVLSGLVSNTIMVDRAVALADAFIRTSVLNMMVSLQDGGQQGDAGGGQGGQQGMQVLRQGMQANEDSPGAGAGLGSFKVINLLQVRDNQQVMLEVKVAKVNRTEAEKLGFDFAGAMSKTGSAWTQLMTGVIGGGAANILVGKNLSADVDLG